MSDRAPLRASAALRPGAEVGGDHQLAMHTIWRKGVLLAIRGASQDKERGFSLTAAPRANRWKDRSGVLRCNPPTPTTHSRRRITADFQGIGGIWTVAG